MITFYLLRHGKRESHEEDTSLSDLGIEQAERTARYLENQNIDAIYASPLKRAQQTANIINQSLNLSVITDDRLKERLVYGDRKGESFDDFLKEWDKTSRDRNYQPSNGDSSYIAGNRMKSLLDEIDKNNTILIVAHGGVIGDFLRNVFLEKELTSVTDAVSNIKYIEILECSITVIQKTGNEYILKKVNDISHLPRPIV